MSHFKAKMHQIRFWLGLRRKPRWGAYSAPPDPLAGFRGLVVNGGEGGSSSFALGRKKRKVGAYARFTNISRQSYDYLTLMPKLRSTDDGRLVYKTSYYEERKSSVRFICRIVRSSERLRQCTQISLRYSLEKS